MTPCTLVKKSDPKGKGPGKGEGTSRTQARRRMRPINKTVGVRAVARPCEGNVRPVT